MAHLVGWAQNGLPVYVDLVESEAATHIARTPHLLTLAAEALQCITLSQPAVTIAYDMKRTVGYDMVVETTAADSIFYAQLVRSTAYTRFTKNGKPLATSHVSITLRRSQQGVSYTMHDIRIGRPVPPPPGNAEQTATSHAYWENHAVIFDNQPIQARSITKICPY